MPDIQKTIRRADEFKAARANYETEWQKVADYMLPSREFTRRSAPGSRRGPVIYNATPGLMVEHLAGALHGMEISPALRWFKLTASDPRMNADADVRRWFDAATDILYRIFTSSSAGFDLAMHEGYLELGAFGNSALFIADRGLAGPRFQSVPMAESFVGLDGERKVNTFYRQYTMTADQVAREWPKTASAQTQKLAATAPTTLVDLIHATEPRPPGEKGKPYLTCYVERAAKNVLEEGQFEEFPFVCPRWLLRAGEGYGYGPGSNALPEVEKLNTFERLNLRGLAKIVDPPMLLPDDGFLNNADFNPGAFNFLRNEFGMNPDMIRPIQTGGRPDLGHAELERIEQRIRSIFYVEWLNLPQQPNMTATEVLQRRDEMLRMMGPMVSRQHTESLNPTILRAFNIVYRNGGFPPPPPALSGASWHVEYLGPLSLAQKASDAQSAMMWMQAVQGMAALDPNVVDIIDTDRAAVWLADRQGAPADLQRGRDTIEQLRQARAQRQQQAEQLQAAQQLAGAAKDGAGAAAAVQGMMQQNGQPAAA